MGFTHESLMILSNEEYLKYEELKYMYRVYPGYWF